MMPPCKEAAKRQKCTHATHATHGPFGPPVHLYMTKHIHAHGHTHGQQCTHETNGPKMMLKAKKSKMAKTPVKHMVYTWPFWTTHAFSDHLSTCYTWAVLATCTHTHDQTRACTWPNI